MTIPKEERPEKESGEFGELLKYTLPGYVTGFIAGALLDSLGFQQSAIGQWLVRTISGESESIFEGVYAFKQRIRRAAGSMAEAYGWGKLQGVSGDETKTSPGYSNARWISGDEQSVSLEVVRLEYYQRAYPNPFNPSVTIEYGMPEAGHVSLRIYNTLGEEMAVLVDGELGAGIHEVEWDGKDHQGRDVPTGVYLYRIMAGSFTETKKMILVR